MNNTGVEITAGLGGFLVVFFLAIAVILLGMDLNRRLRRLRHQEELRLEEERLEQERLEQERGGVVGESPSGRSEDDARGADHGPTTPHEDD